MSSLNNEQKQLIFDYTIGLASNREVTEAELLIRSEKEAAEIHAGFKTAFAPLEALTSEPCPDDLVEQTISRVNKLANPSQHQLEPVLATEQSSMITMRISSWRSLVEFVALAAVIMLIAGILFPTLSSARQKYWQDKCQSQLASIFQGLSNYTADHDGRLPAVPTTPGSPWCKVGYQGEENHSSTRPIWLLVRFRYVENAGDFVCPGRRQGRALQFNISQARHYNDFPASRYVTYSPRIWCPKPEKPCQTGRQPYMSDLNPIFEELRDKLSRALRLNEAMLRINSRNHQGHGQNVLFSDGSTIFMTKRRIAIGTIEDDMYTLQSMSCGSEVNGREWPDCETDVLLAP